MYTDSGENEQTSDNSLSLEEDSRKPKRISKFEISAELKEKLKELPDVLEYIISLQKYLEKQKRKIKKLKRFKVSFPQWCLIFLPELPQFFPEICFLCPSKCEFIFPFSACTSLIYLFFL